MFWEKNDENDTSVIIFMILLLTPLALYTTVWLFPGSGTNAPPLQIAVADERGGGHGPYPTFYPFTGSRPGMFKDLDLVWIPGKEIHFEFVAIKKLNVFEKD